MPVGAFKKYGSCIRRVETAYLSHVKVNS